MWMFGPLAPDFMHPGPARVHIDLQSPWSLPEGNPSRSVSAEELSGTVRDHERRAEDPDPKEIPCHKEEGLVGELGVPDVFQGEVGKEQPDDPDKRLRNNRDPEAKRRKDAADAEQEHARQACGKEIDNGATVHRIQQLRDEQHPCEEYEARECQILPARA